VKEFEDAGYSGKLLERPELDELRDLVVAGEVDVVVVSKRDRLARGLYAGYLKNEFKRRGVELGVYKMLSLTGLAYEDGKLEARWAFGGDLCRDNEPLPPGGCRTPGR
jgi:hypothetical protein